MSKTIEHQVKNGGTIVLTRYVAAERLPARVREDQMRIQYRMKVMQGDGKVAEVDLDREQLQEFIAKTLMTVL